MIDKEKDSDNFWISTSKVHVYMRQIYLIILNAFYISKSINYKTVAFMCVFFLCRSFNGCCPDTHWDPDKNKCIGTF